MSKNKRIIGTEIETETEKNAANDRNLCCISISVYGIVLMWM